MRKVTLGKSGLVVSAMGLGSVQFSKISRRQVGRIISTGLDLGVNFIETASVYFDSEEKIGAVMGKRRDEIVLASKSPPYPAKQFGETIDLSLKRLRTDRIDLYQLHGVDSIEALDRALGPDGSVEAAKKALEQGKILSLGISTHKLEVYVKMAKLGLFDTIQLPISMLHTEVPRCGFLGQARKNNVGIIAMKPMGGGRITDPRLALGYIYRYRQVVPVIGTETPEQVAQLVRLMQHPPKLGPKDFEKIAKIRQTIGSTWCRSCRYCEPCPQGISIYEVLYMQVGVIQQGGRKYLGKTMPKWLKQAEKCVGCGLCETRCPFNLHIIDGLKQSLAIGRDIFKRKQSK